MDSTLMYNYIVLFWFFLYSVHLEHIQLVYHVKIVIAIMDLFVP